MVDRFLRPVKARLLAPAARGLAPVPPAAITVAGLLVGLAAAVAAAVGRFDWALAGWLSNRLLDGLDGEVARVRGTAGARGGYLDLMADLPVYAAIPLGLAAGVARTGLADASVTWAAAAAALAAYYVNLGSYAFLPGPRASVDANDRAAAAPAVALPTGLIEGSETLLAYVLMLALPAWAPWTLGGFALLVLVTAGQRVAWALRPQEVSGRPSRDARADPARRRRPA